MFRSTHNKLRQWTLLAMSSLLAILAMIASGSPSIAQEKDKDSAQNKKQADSAADQKADQKSDDKVKRTQGGARAPFTTSKDWGLKAENLVPRGENPYYYPLKPGFKFVTEVPDHPWGAFRKEVVVLAKTELFNMPGIGKFQCAIVQEEEFFDGVYRQQSHNYVAIDKTNNNVFTFGEVSWEVDQRGRKVFEGTWRAGEPDGEGIAEAGMLMPGKFEIGFKYVNDGQEVEAYGYAENMEKGITLEVPAGKFENCVRIREYSLSNPSDITDKWWAPGVGILKDTSDGELTASTAVPKTDLSTFGMFHRNPVNKGFKPPVAKINGIEATKIALKKIPGKATAVAIERLGKRNVYAVEIIADKDGVEWDVFVDIETGEIVGTDS